MAKGHAVAQLVEALRYKAGNSRVRFPMVSLEFFIYIILLAVRSVVGTATAYGLDGPGIESRWGTRFSEPVQTDPEAHTASCTTGTGSFPGVRCGRRVTLTPQPLLVPRSKIE